MDKTELLLELTREIERVRGLPLDKFIQEQQLHADPDVTDYMDFKNGYELGLIEAKNIILYSPHPKKEEVGG